MARLVSGMPTLCHILHLAMPLLTSAFPPVPPLPPGQIVMLLRAPAPVPTMAVWQVPHLLRLRLRLHGPSLPTSWIVRFLLPCGGSLSWPFLNFPVHPFRYRSLAVLCLSHTVGAPRRFADTCQD